MTGKQVDDLKTEFNANLADNTTGAISAQDVRDAFTNVADSITHVFASGTDAYIKNRFSGHGTALYLRPSGDVGRRDVLSSVVGQWGDGGVNAPKVAAIKFESGEDSTNRDDGRIAFYTAASGNPPLPSGASWPRTMFKRMQITEAGTVEIIGSGVGHIGLHYNRVHHSGVGLYLDNIYGNHTSSPWNQTMGIGHYNTANSVFRPDLYVKGSGEVVVTREGGASVPSSGWAEFHIENRNNRSTANNNNMGTGGRVVFKGYKDAGRGNSQPIYALGTDIKSDSNSSVAKNNFFIQDLYAANNPHRFYIDPSGNIGVGTVAPSGKLHVHAGGSHSGASGVAISMSLSESNTYFDWKLSKPTTEGGGDNTILTLDTRYPAKRNIIAVQSNSVRNSAHVGFGTRTPRGLVEISHGAVAGSGLHLTNTGTGGRRWSLISNHGLATAIEASANKASGCFVVQDSTASITRFAIDSSGNIGIGEIPQTIKGTATKALMFGDNGQNVLATNLNTAGLFAKDTGGTVKLYAFDEGGNQTAISPHVFKMFDQPDPLAWSYYGINHETKQEINVDIYGAIEAIESLTGKKFIFKQNIDGE
jgi:hypothetical protein